METTCFEPDLRQLTDTHQEADRRQPEKRRLVHGWGINDADYTVCPSINGRQVMCPYYVKWRDMLLRQTPKFWETRPTYTGCKVCEEWRSFMAYRSWMMTQDHEGKELDKDLNADGKLYSPDTCVFVSSQVNLFTIDSGATRGEWPIGVDKVGDRFRARCSGATPYHLGLFDTPEEAHEAWRKAKLKLCQELINKQTCPRTILGLTRYMETI